VLALCRIAGLGLDDAEDVCQEVMISVYRGLRTYGGCRLSTWVYRIARRRIADHFRSPQRRDRPFGLPGHRPLQPSPRASAQDIDRRSLARDALDSITRLAEPCRSVVVAYYLGEEPVREIAQTMHMPENTVKSHLRRGRLILRAHLGERR
jgi:RNA polymerase sigma-70 factor (ECF subfamily)